MTNTKRVVAKKVNHPKYTHALYYAGCTSNPKAWLWANSWGWNLYALDGGGRGQYGTLEQAKLRACEFELL